MKVWLCEQFDGEGWSIFAICANLEACRKETLRHYKKRLFSMNIKLKDIEIEDTDNQNFKEINIGWETYNLTLMDVME